MSGKREREESKMTKFMPGLYVRYMYDPSEFQGPSKYPFWYPQNTFPKHTNLTLQTSSLADNMPHWLLIYLRSDLVLEILCAHNPH